MRIYCARKLQAGTTMVDVVVATAVIALAAVGCIGCVIYGFYTMQMVRENQRATQIMLQQAEILRLYSWSEINSNGFVPSTFTANYDPQVTNAEGVIYFGTVTKGSPVFNPSYSPSYGTNLVQFTFSLVWTDRVAHARSLTTFVAKDGMQNYVW